MSPSKPSKHPWLRRAAAVALLCAAGAITAVQATEVGNDEDEVVGELIGELMFRADLLGALDALCPSRGPANDWHAALPPLPPESTTPELLDLSRRLGTDAGQQLVSENGGCTTRDFAAAYDESRHEFDALLERWHKL
jgi:hypothetical protein